jgi:two-component sensor histidine kinase
VAGLDQVRLVAMVIHELATNALKYGALSNGSSHVSVRWERHFQPNLAKLVWQESGGPEINPPQRKGFGSHLIERAFGGKARRNSCSARKTFLALSKSSLKLHNAPHLR